MALREALLNTLTHAQLAELSRAGAPTADPTADEPSRGTRIGQLARRRFVEGGTWATTFVKTLGLPAALAGARPPKPAPAALIVAPHRPPPELKPFQARLRDGLLRVLRGEAEHHRAIVSLPTGGGKTRTAGEALCRRIDEDDAPGGFYLWIAQSEELCDQATACLTQLWAGRAYAQPLAVYRYYGGRRPGVGADGAADSTVPGGLVVASIQQLHARLGCPGDFERALLRGLRAVVIDEAHRATSASYMALFEAVAAANPLADRVPVGGLTATPGRSGGQTGDLVRAFGGVLLTPDLPEVDAADPLEYFRSRGFLARPDHETVATAYRVRLRPPRGLVAAGSATARAEYEARLARELARADRRNALIVRRLAAVPPGTPTLVYACNVEHVRVLHVMLRAAGRSSGYIVGDTRRGDRARAIAAFREGRLDFLVNYGVLTTGFDAPRTACVAITRPVFSEVLYEQIVGRGLRGPAFGGTERCLILDFEDNLATFGDQRAYHRFARFWDTARTVEAQPDPDAYADANRRSIPAPPAAAPPRSRKRGTRLPGQAGLF